MTQKFIRLNIPVEASEQDDALWQAFAKIPNGLKMHICKHLLIQNLPKDNDGLMALIGAVLANKSISSIAADAKSEEPVVQKKEAMVQPVAMVEVVKEVEVVSGGSVGLDAFSNLCGGKNW